MRTNTVTIVIGTRNSGKTFYTQKVIEAYKRKVLVCDTYKHPKYSEFERIKPSEIRNIESGKRVRVYGKETELILLKCNDFYNGLLVFEDATKYVGSVLTKDMKQLVYDTKQKNVDLMFLFHSFTGCPADLFRISDNLIILKVGDHPSLRKMDLPEYNKVLEAYNKVMSLRKAYPREFVKLM